MKFKTIHLYCRFVQYKLKFVLSEQPFIIEKLRGFVKIHMKILSIYPLLSYRFIRSILWLISDRYEFPIAFKVYETTHFLNSSIVSLRLLKSDNFYLFLFLVSSNIWYLLPNLSSDIRHQS